MLSLLSTTSNIDLTELLCHMSTIINCYFSIFLFLFGTIGNILNMLVLIQRSLRSNPCAWLFLISSLANFIAILAGLTTRMISYWTTDITDTVGWLCKLRVFTLYTSRTIACWLIVLASIDRWLLSCPEARRRQMSTLKNVQQGTLIIILLSILLYLPIIYCYEANLINTPLRCYSKTIQCRIFSDQAYTFITILIPLILMFLFGLKTLENVRQIKYRLQSSPLLPRSSTTSTKTDHRHRFRLIDRHLFIMLLVQISFLALFTLPQAVQQIYSTITRDTYKTSTRIAVENSIYSFGILLTYLSNGMPFYIYTLTGGWIFRQAFFSLITPIKQTICCQHE